MNNYPKRTSRTLGSSPSFFGVPGELILPFLIILVPVFAFGSIVRMSLQTYVILIFSCMLFWWLLTGKHTYLFLSMLIRRRTPKFRRTRVLYHPLLYKKPGGGRHRS